MALPRSTYYDAPAELIGNAEILRCVETICDEFEAYGYRRVGAELRHQGIIVNAKKVRRLMPPYRGRVSSLRARATLRHA